MKQQFKFSVAGASSTLTALVFALAGAIPIFINMANAAGLSSQAAASIIMWGMGAGGVISILLSLRFRQPIYAAPSITAVAILTPMLTQFSLGEIVFGYLVAGVVLLLLGAFGLIGKAAKFLPLPIVLGMVAGVFMSYGINLVKGAFQLPLAGAVILAAFFVTPAITKKVPPQAVSLLAAVLVTFFLLPDGSTGAAEAGSSASSLFTAPLFILPKVNLQVIPLVSLPLVIMSVADIFKGYGVLRANDYPVSLNTVTTYCGVASCFSAFGIGHPQALAGPAIAIVAGKDAGPREQRYLVAVFYSAGTFVLIALAGFFTSLLARFPGEVIDIICGLAMIGLLTSSLKTAFGTPKFTLGALTAFVIGLSHVSLGGLGAPVLAILFGLIVSLLTEREDFKQD